VQLVITNLTTGDSATLAHGPQEIDHRLPRSFEETKVFGAKPVIVSGAIGARACIVELEFIKSDVRIFREIVLPALGSALEPAHELQLAWGASSQETFTGRPLPFDTYKENRPGPVLYSIEVKLELIESRTPPVFVQNTRGQTVQLSAKKSHTVRAGETLARIAALEGVTVAALAKANGDRVAWTPEAGTKLVIP
jgi:hypothetical protein